MVAIPVISCIMSRTSSLGGVGARVPAIVRFSHYGGAFSLYVFSGDNSVEVVVSNTLFGLFGCT